MNIAIYKFVRVDNYVKSVVKFCMPGYTEKGHIASTQFHTNLIIPCLNNSLKFHFLDDIVLWFY